jgi:hypothetical protein
LFTVNSCCELSDQVFIVDLLWGSVLESRVATSSIDPAAFLHDQLAAASPDLLRDMLSTFIQALMSAEADAVCGAPYGPTASTTPTS